ncbi:hypothetical protein P4E94_14525 [Pontiellaceae bacterium B12219]|nr:hypothetical protein [Pontiellaceae bacterium B12219]
MSKKKRMTGALVFAMLGSMTAQTALVGEWAFDSQTFENSGTTGPVHDGMFVTANSDCFSTDTVSEKGFSLRIKSISEDPVTGGGDVLLINNSKTTDAGYLSTFDGAAFTVSIWIKAEDDFWRDFDELGGKSAEENSTGKRINHGWVLRSRGTTMRFEPYGNPAIGTRSCPLDGSWHLITATYDGAESRFDFVRVAECTGNDLCRAALNQSGDRCVFGNG